MTPVGSKVSAHLKIRAVPVIGGVTLLHSNRTLNYQQDQQ